MKRIVISFIAVSSLLACCSVEPLDTTKNLDTRVKMQFAAEEVSSSNATGSKTTLSEGALIWSSGDAISIFSGSENNQFNITEGAGSKSATFEGLSSVSDEYVALYPYSASATYASNSISAEIPSHQTAGAASSFDSMLNPAVAKSTNNTLQFYNVGAFMKIEVTGLSSGVSVEQIVISATQSLAGAYTVDVSGTDSYTAVSSESCAGVTLSVADGNVGPYYAVILADEYENLTIKVLLSDGTYISKTWAEPVTFARNEIRGTTIDASANMPTENTQGLYGLYEAGFDLEIGGKIYNKATYGSALLISTATELTSVIGNNSGVYFIDSDATLTLNYEGAAYKFLLIGNDVNKKSPVKLSAFLRTNSLTNTDGELLLYNVDLDATSTSLNYAIVNYGAKPSDIRVIDSRIQLASAKPFIACTTNGRYYNNIDLQGNTFKLNGNANFMNLSSNPATMQNINMSNNIFYDGGTTAISNYKMFYGTSAGIGKLTFENNTLVNVKVTTGLFLYNSLGEVALGSNLIYLDEIAANMYIFKPTTINGVETGQTYIGNPEKGYCNLSYSYAAKVTQVTNTSTGVTSDPGRQWFYGGMTRVVLNPETEMQSLTENPFGENLDIANEVFTPIADYASYGAQR